VAGGAALRPRTPNLIVRSIVAGRPLAVSPITQTEPKVGPLVVELA